MNSSNETTRELITDLLSDKSSMTNVDFKNINKLNKIKKIL